MAALAAGLVRLWSVLGGGKAPTCHNMPRARLCVWITRGVDERADMGVVVAHAQYV